jgi:hypothetical protein
MKINWHNFTMMNRQAIEAEIDRRITEESYGDWTLTELLRVNSLATKIAELRVVGRSISGRGDEVIDPLNFFVKIKVLTRQACKYDKDGNFIDGYSRYKLSGNKETFIDGQGETKKYICPDLNDPPKTGDKVYVKRHRRKDSHDRKWVSEERFKLEEQTGRPVKDEEFLYDYKVYTVDKDGCILVKDPAIALQILKNRGKRLAKPQRSKVTRVTPGQKAVPERIINNWHFEEVSPKEKKIENQSDEIVN